MAASSQPGLSKWGNHHFEAESSLWVLQTLNSPSWRQNLGEVEKNCFTALLSHSLQWAAALKTMCADLEGAVRSLTAQRGCDQLMDTFPSTGGEVSGREHHQPSGFNQFGVSMLVVILLTSTWWGLQQLKDIVACIP